jgi:hypothetical protein
MLKKPAVPTKQLIEAGSSMSAITMATKSSEKESNCNSGNFG